MANSLNELNALLDLERTDTEDWIKGRIPWHYKRLTCGREKAIELAKLGAKLSITYFDLPLYFTQSVIFGAIFSGDYDRLVICTPSQYGKLIADDEDVLTRAGWKKHGELEVGDEVISPNGEFVKIIQIHPKQHTDRIVEFMDGDAIECHHNHEWVVFDKNSKTRVYSTDYMREHLKSKDARFSLIHKLPLKGEEKDLAVPPYVMGAWLGDGATTKGQICGCPDDKEVLEKCRQYYPEGSHWVHNDTITISCAGLQSALHEYGLCYQEEKTEKYIPEEYLTASLSQRLELLAGLIDTDGCQYEKDGRFYFTTADEKLKNSFVSLISTFGWVASVVANEPRMSSHAIQGKKEYYRIGFNPTCDIPCVLERKKPKRIVEQRRIGIKSIRECEPHGGNCITVEGGVYCVGKRLKPTHNSFLMGHIALLKAFMGEPQYIAGGTADMTNIIMWNTLKAIGDAAPEIQNNLLEKADRLEKLTTSASKTKIAFREGGFVEPASLGDMYGDIDHNKAVGRGGNYIIDEAAEVSEDTFAEMGRAEFARTDNKSYQIVMISNPHRPGVFYDGLTEEAGERTLVVWMDALTAIEEKRWTRERVLNSEFAKKNRTRRVYLLCELEETGNSMFDEPVLYRGEVEGDYVQHFMGVDSAYKGKDNITVSINAVTDDGHSHIELIRHVDKPDEWIDGVTSEDIADQIAKLARIYHVALICVDIGWGVWLVEALTKRGLNVKGINFQERPNKKRVAAKQYAAVNAANKRAEMHLDLQDLMENKAIEFEEEAWEQIKAIMPYVTEARQNNGKILIRKKTEIKAMMNGKSPDELDSVLLSIQAAIIFGGESLTYE